MWPEQTKWTLQTLLFLASAQKPRFGSTFNGRVQFLYGLIQLKCQRAGWGGFFQHLNSKEKKHYLYDSIIPVLKIEIAKRKQNKVELNLDTVENMFMRYYRDEEYYLQALQEVRSLLNQIKSLGK